MCSAIFIRHDLILDLSLIFLFQIFFVLEILDLDFLVQPARDFSGPVLGLIIAITCNIVMLNIR